MFQVWLPSGLRPYENDTSIWINPDTGKQGTHHEKAVYEIGKKTTNIFTTLDKIYNNFSDNRVILGQRSDFVLSVSAFEECTKKIGTYVKNICQGYMKSVHEIYHHICSNQSTDYVSSLTDSFHKTIDMMNTLSNGSVMAPMWNKTDEAEKYVNSINIANISMKHPEGQVGDITTIVKNYFDEGLHICSVQKENVSNIHHGLTDALLCHRQLRQVLDTVNMIENCGKNMLEDLDTISPALMQADTVLNNVRKGYALAKDNGQSIDSAIKNSMSNLNITNRLKNNIDILDKYKSALLSL